MATTADPDLHLIVDGVRVSPSMVADRAHVFRVELPADEVRLVSRATRPSDIGGSSDSRLLGVAVSGMRLQQGAWKFDISLDEPELIDGFHGFEPEGWRWTNGDAALPHATFASVSGAFLFIVFAWAAPAYPLVTQEDRGHERLFLGFESLGDDCEFGFVQRHHEAEPMGLLRWSNIGVSTLLACLDQSFEGLGEMSNTELIWSPGEGEYKLQDLSGFSAHTWITERRSDPEEEARIKRYGCMQLRLLRRKLVTDIEGGRKIFVYKSSDPGFSLPHQERLHRALRRIGPSALLCVQIAEPGERVGHVEDRGDGLLVGFIDRFVLAEGPYQVWRAICRQAHALQAHRLLAAPASGESRVA